MSADNYHVVRKHPSGGYTYVQGFASDDDPDLSVTERDSRFETFEDALEAAVVDYSEYGATVHPECVEWADSMDRVWYREGIKAAREAVAAYADSVDAIGGYSWDEAITGSLAVLDRLAQEARP